VGARARAIIGVMSDDQADRGIEAQLGELWNTPVGRRWLLKAGLGSAAAVGAQLYARPAVAAARRTRLGVPAGELQFALGALPGVTDLTAVANGRRIPLRHHTAGSRETLRRRARLWRLADLSKLTHHVTGLELPEHQSMLVSVHGRRGGQDVVVAQVWHVPPSATVALAIVARGLQAAPARTLGVTRRLRRLGIDPSASLSPADLALLDTVGDTDQTAIALTSVHPNIATKAPAEAAVTKSLLAGAPEVQTLGKTIAQLQRAGQDYATLVTAVDAHGQPAEIRIPVKDAAPVVSTFQTFSLNDAAKLSRAVTDSVSAGIRGVRDTADLGAVIDQPLVEIPRAAERTWVQPVGVLPQPQARTQRVKDPGLEIKVKNPGLNFGTYVTVDGSLANGKLPLKLYNNYVRWASVYVQYLGAGGKNLSLNPNPKGADTKYSQYLGMLPQVFTVLGIPIWDSNTIEATLQFPPGAHSARLLLCGLGSDANDGGWRQYFPADAYPGQISPSGEVMVPAILTGLLTIGLTTFALATDFDVAVVWSEVRSVVDDALQEANLLANVIAGLLRGAIVSLTATEIAALATATGSEQLHQPGPSLWRTLLSLATVIPKVLFGASGAGLIFTKIGAAVAAAETAEKILDAIPIIGEVLAVIATVGDGATLAEVAFETLASPWAIENEISLTYQAKVTVSVDKDNASTWPATARSWRLEALVDGALTLDPITGTVNDGGKARSDPLVTEVTAPFGGKQIQWSFVALDASGRQVGTGVSDPQTNDDPAKPPTAIAITLKQIPATITAATVFERSSTTTYDTHAGGYTWSDQVGVRGTVASDHAEDVSGTAVATRAGVAAMVFKRNDRYYLRGVPVAQNGSTITLGVAPTEGYARRPFVLLDAFVGKGAGDDHVLLEPDDTSDAYHVRRLKLDSATGALSWDRDASYGTFLLEPSAVALHSSGRVVAVHTDSGRLGWLRPADTPQPVLASYAAGPGNQPGLLSSPIAVAVTNPGVVLVLEAGSAQLASFDLNGNPVRYFAGTDGTRQFRRALASSGTPLDLAVDGAGQIYVLYFTGAGSAPSDYHVDVYTASGDVLDTHSPGVNVGRLAVDYWRSIYGANYDPLIDLGTTTARVDPRLGVNEPSLSRFDPSDETDEPPPHRHHRHRHHPPRFTG
jgi:hypothetical protein